MKRISILIACQFLFLNITFGNETDSLLTILEQTMLKRQKYDTQKELRIKNLKELSKNKKNSIEQTFYLNNQIIKEYEAYNFDSTMFYIEQNLALCEQLEDKKDKYLNQTRLTLADLLAASGRYKEAVDILNAIEKLKLSNNLWLDYYMHYRSVYQELQYHSSLKTNLLKYRNLYNSYTDSLLSILNPEAPLFLELKEARLREEGQLLEAKKVNNLRLEKAEINSRKYSLITYERSLLYQIEKNSELQKKYLALSAISDIKSSIKDNASLTQLALLLYQEKNITKSYAYINFAMEDAIFFNSRLRFLVLSSILPLINDAYQIESEKQKANLRLQLIIISILGFILLLAVFYIYHQMKKLSLTRGELQQANKQLKELNFDLRSANSQLNDLNRELFESNHVKEQYIAKFLGICSNYIDKLDSYRKMVNKQIMAKKVKELFEKTKSLELIDYEVNEYYKNFDTTFLSIYPGFVKELNELLNKNEQIVLKKGELLTTELRIFALIRLGITDSSKIAKLLRYSVNTIYNYRVKMKNKAAGLRDEFEDRVKKIGAFLE
jgi:hypothetical protein